MIISFYVDSTTFSALKQLEAAAGGGKVRSKLLRKLIVEALNVVNTTNRSSGVLPVLTKMEEALADVIATSRVDAGGEPIRTRENDIAWRVYKRERGKELSKLAREHAQLLGMPIK